ncbi:DUF6527 family protein [Roseivirga seohaensis]|uniref:DUF6527 family protein n=1 Tax=Roseivirga seohaensis TaxID=1914963 RepID=UPI003BAA4DCB
MKTIEYSFVTEIPELLDEGVLYISTQYGTVLHKCCCGCGNEVVTPLSPTDWYLKFDGESVSLSPSIGNWSFACQSHYFIKRNQVQWCKPWTSYEIEEGRVEDKSKKKKHFKTKKKKKGFWSLFSF